jgi:hypothetical protein
MQVCQDMGSLCERKTRRIKRKGHGGAVITSVR